MLHSINVRVIFFTVIIATALLTSFGYYNYQSTSTALYEELDNKTSFLVKRLQITLPATLWNYQTEQMNKIIDSEIQPDFIRGIFIMDGEKVTAGRTKSPSGQLVDSKTTEYEGQTKNNILEYDDSGSISKVGDIVLQINTNPIERQLNQYAFAVILQTLVLDLGIVISIIYLLRRLVIRPVNKIALAMADIAQGEGDLTKRIPVKEKNEISQLVISFNSFVDKIQNLVIDTVGAIDQMSSATEDMTQIAATTKGEVDNQRLETDSVASAMLQMSTSVEHVAENASQAADASEGAEKTGENMKSVLEESINKITMLADKIDNGTEVINTLEKNVDEIASVLEVIRGIAEQTNLLALNAAIEAARAGEQGRGFAVVADEVRTLASRTQDSTQEIERMIERLQTGTRQAVTSMKESKEYGESTVEQAKLADESLQQIVEAVRSISQMNTQIASAVHQQSHVSEDISKSIRRIVDIADNTTNSTDKSASHAQQIKELNTNLKTTVSQFKV